MSKRLRLLTVGDGDLTLSLAIARCYGVEHVDLTASTFLSSPQSLVATYPHTAATTIRELENVYGATILYGMDACKLHLYEFPTDTVGTVHSENANIMTQTVPKRQRPFDMTLFQHPHLGDYSAGEMDLLHRHCILLAHYLDSAQQIAEAVHVTLCANQADTWRLESAAARAGLVLSSIIPVQRPFHQIFTPSLSYPWTTDPNWQSSYRGEKNNDDNSVGPSRRRQVISRRQGGSRNWMVRYGYNHVRTAPSNSSGLAAAPMLAGSVHYVFRPHNGLAHTVTRTVYEESSSSTITCATIDHSCPICERHFQTREALQIHLDAPAVPFDIPQYRVPSIHADNSNPPLSLDDGTLISRHASDASILSSPDASTETRDRKRIKNQDLSCSSELGNGDSRCLAPEMYATGSATWHVTMDTVGKRLRWFLQHIAGASAPFKRSKREWDHMIKEGRIAVNGAVALDSSRILQEEGWTVTVELSTGIRNGIGSSDLPVHESKPLIKVSAEWSRVDVGQLLVVWKPVGMRAIGSFDSSTLEETLARQRESQTGLAQTYACLSKLDKGTSGLCVLHPREETAALVDSARNFITISHTFSALVHGPVSKDWKLGVWVRLPFDGVRRWKKRPSDTNNAAVCSMKENDDLVYIVLLEETVSNDDARVPKLSTISMTTRSSSSRLAQTFAYYLRKTVNNPIVGDRIAVQEYLSLPRSMRNRIKQRFCIGCTAVRVENHSTGELNEDICPIPDKWSARNWLEFCAHPLRSQADIPCILRSGDSTQPMNPVENLGLSAGSSTA
jgi:23S rRNA-/tRNA-specific pseudouridylate synthase